MRLPSEVVTHERLLQLGKVLITLQNPKLSTDGNFCTSFESEKKKKIETYCFKMPV